MVLFLIITTSINAVAEGGGWATVRGTVRSSGNERIELAIVFLKNTNFAGYSGTDGKFVFKAPAGHYTLCARIVGYETFEKEVDLKPDEIFYLTVRLKAEVVEIEDVEVTGQSIVQQVNKTAFNVSAIDAKLWHNSSLDISQALAKVSGVKIKQTGGLGSETRISLNGFTGKHVKVFMDGVPMEGAGSSMQLNKIPVNMADRIEVYKGVVPVELGADALGGAINIVSKQTNRTFLDASYSYGSFNTHKSNVSFGRTTGQGIIYQFSFYQNYSDNSYRVKTKLLDLETNTYSKTDQWFRRFHDQYHNEAVIGKIGIRDKKWATRLILETTLSQEKADIQNANLMKIVFGGKRRTAQSIIPALYYSANNLFVDKLNFSLSAKYNIVRSNNIDTLARQYNWKGDYRLKSSVGESEYSLSEYNNYSGYYVGNLNYKLGEKQFFSLNHVYSSFSRKATDAAANYENSTEATFMKRTNNKNITGLSYRYEANKTWNALLFGKYYAVKVGGPIDVSDTSTPDYEEQTRNFNALGYGLAASYMLTTAIQLKGSFEKSYRLPTENELFGDEVLETGDASLNAENSDNINFNINYNRQINKIHSFNVEVGLVYRNTRDYIRRLIEQKYGGAYYTNHGNVLTLGADLDVRYSYKKKFFIGSNITYQDIRNKERYSATGQTLIYYNDRMPNVPYLFSNTDLSYSWTDVVGKADLLSLDYSLQYVHDFFRNWESEGGDIIIPAQLSHDLSLNYAMKKGRYNIALEARNITNEILYDNYSLQKPGRSFYVKFRYFFYQ